MDNDIYVSASGLRERLEKELAAVRAQRDQAIAVIQQATGAEKAISAALILVSDAEAEKQKNRNEASPPLKPHREKRGALNGVPTL